MTAQSMRSDMPLPDRRALIQRGATAPILGLILASFWPLPNQGAILEDFSNPVDDPNLTNCVEVVATEGEGRFDGFSCGKTTAEWDCLTYPLDLQERPVQELSADLTFADVGQECFAMLCLGTPDRGYLLLKRTNEALLIKATSVDHWTLLGRCSHSSAWGNENASLHLSTAPRGDAVAVTAWVVSEERSTVFKSEFLDGPGSDIGPYPSVLHGIRFEADAGAPLDVLDAAGLGLIQLSEGAERGGTIYVDNLAVKSFDIPSIMDCGFLAGSPDTFQLLYTGNTMEEQVVLGAETLPGTWNLIFEAIREGTAYPSLAVSPSTGTRFYRLATGHYFEDDFGGGQPPWDLVKRVGQNLSLLQTDGTMRLASSVGGSCWGFIMPPSPDPYTVDSASSIDILDWQSSADYLYISLMARGKGMRGGTATGYQAYLRISGSGAQRVVRLEIMRNNRNNLLATRVVDVTPAKDYRLRFDVTGVQLRAELSEIDDAGNVIEQVGMVSASNSTYHRKGLGRALYYLHGGGPASFTVDYFRFVGTPLADHPCTVEY